MIGSRLDSWLARSTVANAPLELGPYRARMLNTPGGTVRVLDSGASQACVVMVPDGPNVIEHYLELIPRLAPSMRVVCFDMPGFGFSAPAPSYGHTLDQGASVVLSVLDQLQIPSATLAFTCANGFYALRAARLWPERITSLFLSQTPALSAMHDWAARNVPRPLRVPVVGQLLGRATRQLLAERWYGIALPRGVERERYRAPARLALQGGGCFSLAGVVQGLLASPPEAVHGVSTPCSMLWGTSDWSHRNTTPTSLRECAADAQISLHDCGHFPDLEQSDRYVELLRSHLYTIGARA